MNAAIELEYFENLFGSVDIGARGVIAVYRRDNFTLVMHKPGGPGTVNEPLPPGSAARQSMGLDRKTATVLARTVIRGNTYIFGFHSLDRYPFFVAVGLEVNDVLAGWRTRSLAVGLAGLLVLLLLAGVLQRLSRSETQERQAIANLQAIADNAPFSIRVRTNSDSRLVFANRFSVELSGYTAEELRRLPFAAVVHPDHRATISDFARRRTAGDPTVPACYESQVTCKDGRSIPVEINAAVTTWNGHPAKLIITSDIGTRKEAERQLQRSLAEKETLLREIHHRVKNNLQIVSSLLYFQARKVKDPDDLAVLNDGRDRLRAMMLVHEKLYQSNDLSRVDFESYVRALTAQIAESHAPRGRRIATRVETGPCTLPIEIATPCGLLICELLINAFKYAFPDGRDGTVAVRMTAAGGRLAIVVADDGVGLPAGVESGEGGSFGWQLIVNLAAQIDGAISVARDPGTAVTVSFPIPETAA